MRFRAVVGEAMLLLLVFMEFLPDQFLACQGVSLLDGTTFTPSSNVHELEVHILA